MRAAITRCWLNGSAANGGWAASPQITNGSLYAFAKSGGHYWIRFTALDRYRYGGSGRRHVCNQGHGHSLIGQRRPTIGLASRGLFGDKRRSRLPVWPALSRETIAERSPAKFRLSRGNAKPDEMINGREGRTWRPNPFGESGQAPSPVSRPAAQGRSVDPRCARASQRNGADRFGQSYSFVDRPNSGRCAPIPDLPAVATLHAQLNVGMRQAR